MLYVISLIILVLTQVTANQSVGTHRIASLQPCGQWGRSDGCLTCAGLGAQEIAGFEQLWSHFS